MADISQYKITDIYTGTLVRVSTTEALQAWLMEKQATQTKQFHSQLNNLMDALEYGSEDYYWHGVTLMLEIQPKKKARRRTK